MKKAVRLRGLERETFSNHWQTRPDRNIRNRGSCRIQDDPSNRKPMKSHEKKLWSSTYRHALAIHLRSIAGSLLKEGPLVVCLASHDVISDKLQRNTTIALRGGFIGHWHWGFIRGFLAKGSFQTMRDSLGSALAWLGTVQIQWQSTKRCQTISTTLQVCGLHVNQRQGGSLRPVWPRSKIRIDWYTRTWCIHKFPSYLTIRVRRQR